MEKIKVTNGVYWLDIPEANLFVLCGCPADVIKHLMKKGFIVSKVKDGVNYETGPNAILLSDISIQNGSFANLAEFPILQMLYRQGMLLPNHPNHNGFKPILIGTASQIHAQSQYIYRGNYGLTSLEEIIKTGTAEPIANTMYNIKLKFAFNRIFETEELIDFCIVDAEPVPVRNGVEVCRKELNVYEFTYQDKRVTVDLNLASQEAYEPPINLDFHRIKREYFSVIHIGEGDGWDINRPCMSSIITFRGKIYLIDAGPNILHSLTALGISVNELEGIFHTHAHDDHFAGLTSLVRSDHLIKYYAPALVRASVVSKLSALMNISEERFSRLFEIHDLQFNRWNNINGLEVKPVFSPHPVETAIYFFRSFWTEGYKTYAHCADIASLATLRKYLVDAPDKNAISEKLFDTLTTNLFTKADIKKIDIGGGLIHGSAEDFIDDNSSKIILSHTAAKLSDSQKEIGSNATFGLEDVLIPAHQDYSMQAAYQYLKAFYPQVPQADLDMLLNCPVVSFNVGLIIIKKNVISANIFVILHGVVEYIDSQSGFTTTLSAGSILGEEAVLTGKPSLMTCRAMSYVKALQIPVDLYREFIRRNFDFKDMYQIFTNRLFLQSTWLFGEMISSMVQNTIAQLMYLKHFEEGESIETGNTPTIFMLKKGRIQVLLDDKVVDNLAPGEFFGEESIFFKKTSLLTARATQGADVYVISGEVLKNKPIIEWKMLETFERRLKAFGSLFT